MKFLIVGLGNPGEKYTMSRHNVGFLTLDMFVEKNEWQKSSRANALYAKKNIGEYEVEFVKPETYMNNSGVAVSYASKKYNLSSDHIIIVCDDIDLPLGKIRIAKKRGSGGHNGLRSVASYLGTEDFIRVRVGISRTDEDGHVRKPRGGLFTSKANAVANFVLKKFTLDEQKKLYTSLIRVKASIEMIVTEGIQVAMNTYN